MCTNESKFETVYLFLKENNEFITERGEYIFDKDFKSKLFNKFCKGREIKCPSYPKTIQDDFIKIILKEYYNSDNVNEWIEIHRKSMSAENILGTYLEIYIASVIEEHGWIWCSGEIVKSIDFIKRTNGSWKKLQIKNRSNSENSSSNKIRKGTDIKKWFRSNATTGKTMWENFPDDELTKILSEKNFVEFVVEYLHSYCME